MSLNPSDFLPSLREMGEIADETLNESNESFTTEELQELDQQLGIERPSKKQRRRSGGFRNPLSPELSKKMGEANSRYIEQDFLGAAELLLEVIKAAPHVAAPYNTLGLIYEELGRPKDALQVYVLAAHFTPKDSGVWIRLVDMAKDLGEYKQAFICLTRLLRMNCDDVDALWERSMLYEEIGDLKRATEGLKSLNAKKPHDRRVIKKLSTMLYQRGRSAASCRVLERYMDWVKAQVSNAALGNLAVLWDLTIVNMLCELYMQEDFYDKAQQLIELTESVGVCANLPPELQIRLSMCRLYSSEPDAASSLLNHISTLDTSTYGELFIEAGDALLEMQHYEEARTAFAMLETEPTLNNNELWLRQARCLEALPGHELEAIQMCRKVLDACPGELECSILLAGILNRRGSTTSAIELLEAAGLYMLREQHAQPPTLPSSSKTPVLPMDARKIRLLHCTATLYMQELRYESLLELCHESVSDVLSVLVGLYPEAQDSTVTTADAAVSEKQRVRHVPPVLQNGLFLELTMHVIRCLCHYKRYEEAVTLLDAMLRICWTDQTELIDFLPRLREMAVNVFFNARRFGRAYTQVRQLLLDDPHNPVLANILAIIMHRLRYPDRMRRFVIRTLLKAPTSVSLRVLLAHSSLLKRSFGQACREYLRAYTQSPATPCVLMYAAIALLNRALLPSVNRRHQLVLHSLSLLHEYVRQHQGSADALYVLARAYDALGGGGRHIARALYHQVLQRCGEAQVPPRAQQQHVVRLNANGELEIVQRRVHRGELSREAAHNLALLYEKAGALELARRILYQYIVF